MKTVSNRISFALITLLFFYLGFITVLVDSLIPRLRELFSLTYFQSGLVQFAFFSAYFLLSIPSSWILSKLSYKWGIVGGLITMATGCVLFYPAAEYRVFGTFIAGYFILAGGMTLLQVAINPYVTLLGDESEASSRLTLAQAFNSLGTSIAPLVGAAFILSDTIKTQAEIIALEAGERLAYLSAEASAVQKPFVFIAASILVTALIFSRIKLPAVSLARGEGTYGALLRKPNLVFGVLGIFFYVGAEVAIGSYLVNYFLDMGLNDLISSSDTPKRIAEFLLGDSLSGYDGKAIVGVFVTFYWTGAMIGRFVGTYLNSVFSPGRVLASFALGALTLVCSTVLLNGFASAIAVLAIGLCNSLMFPTIFSLALKGLGDAKSRASGMLCTAIVGGAILPPLFGHVADIAGFSAAFSVVAVSYSYIAFYGFYQKVK